MTILSSQPDVFRHPDLPAFYCGTLRVARTLRNMYTTEGLDLEEVGLAHTMESLLYTIPLKCEADLGAHLTNEQLFEQ